MLNKKESTLPTIIALIAAGTLAAAVIITGILIAIFVFGAKDAYAKERTPLPPQHKVVDSFNAKITYYNSLPGQTSGDPNITADGTRTHRGVVAANCLPFGTNLRIPALFGREVFQVHDRGGFGCDHVDVWLPVGESFGTTRAMVELLK